jgi:hypothetical protein
MSIKSSWLAPLLLLAMSYTGQAATVDLALVLATDVSGSVDAIDFDLMRTGYVNAFNNLALVNAIQGGPLGQIAVTFVYWSSSATQVVPWTIINDAATASAFATAIDNVARPFAANTAVTNAVNFSASLFGSAPTATRQVIDIAGDGAENIECLPFRMTCVPLQSARNAFLTGGSNRTINALWIQDGSVFGVKPGDDINALTYGTTNVIGGPGAFQDIAASFNDFGAAMEAKLIREINPVPEPATSALFAGALGLIGLIRIRRN